MTILETNFIRRIRGQSRAMAHERSKKTAIRAFELLEGRHLLAFSVTDVALLLPPTEPQSLIHYESRWNYLADGSDQGSGWRESNFDDSTWSQAGRQPLGYGAENFFELTTRISCGPTNPLCNADNFATSYFRHSFGVGDPASLVGLTAGMSRTDPVAVYLNGVEVFRDDNLPPSAAFADYAGGPADGSIGFTIQPRHLVTGRNVIAVEIHQQGPTDTRLSFDLQLTALSPVASPARPHLELRFSDPVDSASIDSSDVDVNGAVPVGFTIVDPTTVRFELPELPQNETLNVSIPAGTISQDDASRTSIESFHTEVPTAIPAQYMVKHTPRLQPGDMPLSPYPGSSTDQVDILWQTIPAGNGTDDRFVVQYRRSGGSAPWVTAPVIEPIVTGVDDRLIHAAQIRGLDYDADYDYRVRHMRDQLIVNEYAHSFHTRLPSDSDQPFTFAAYGDSARLSTLSNFRVVHNQINQSDSAFALLLGDNVYPFGRHQESDSRFDPSLSPEATQWAASHIDYATIGNHESIINIQPFREFFSNPIPREGINAPAAPQATEPLEHNYSFDYGNVHFATFDSTSLHDAKRLDGLLKWIEADVEASDATWKIVFAHHPVAFVPDKPESPADNYYQQVVPRLLDLGVDVFLVGHSHTYSRTKPLLGQIDGVATFVDDQDNAYDKGAGLVQVVAGASGRSLRPGSYSGPGREAVAVGFTTETETPIAYGFSQFHVTPTQLTVKYVTTPDGTVLDSFSIVDTQLNPGTLTGRFRPIAPNPRIHPVEEIQLTFSRPVTGVDLGDLALTRDGGTNLLDGTASLRNVNPRTWILANISAHVNLPGLYEVGLNASRSGIRDAEGVALADDVIAAWQDIRQPGDANLDGQFDTKDIVSALAGNKYLSGEKATWEEGDWNGDGVFNQLDLVAGLRAGLYLQGPYFRVD